MCYLSVGFRLHHRYHYSLSYFSVLLIDDDKTISVPLHQKMC